MMFNEIVQRVKGINPGKDKVLLSFSRGKDSWAAWCALKDHFDVYPFYYYNGPPNLEFKEDSFEYAERKIGRKVLKLPSPLMNSLLSAKNCGFQTPERVLMLDAIEVPEFGYDLVQQVAAQCFGLPDGTYTALGVRAADSARRALHFKCHGPITEKQQKFYPIWDWDKADVLMSLIENQIELPIDYKIFGRTFDGLYLQYLEAIAAHFPRDWQRILDIFPLIDLELYRHGKRQVSN